MFVCLPEGNTIFWAGLWWIGAIMVIHCFLRPWRNHSWWSQRNIDIDLGLTWYGSLPHCSIYYVEQLQLSCFFWLRWQRTIPWMSLCGSWIFHVPFSNFVLASKLATWIETNNPTNPESNNCWTLGFQTIRFRQVYCIDFTYWCLCPYMNNTYYCLVNTYVYIYIYRILLCSCVNEDHIYMYHVYTYHII